MSMSTSTTYSSLYCSCSTRNNSFKSSSVLSTAISILLFLLTWLATSSSIVKGEQFKVSPNEQLTGHGGGQISQRSAPNLWSTHHNGRRILDRENVMGLTPDKNIHSGIFQESGTEDTNAHYAGPFSSPPRSRGRRSDPTLPIQRRSPSTTPEIQRPLVPLHSVPKRFRSSGKKEKRRGWKSGRKPPTVGRRKLVIPPKFMLDLYYAYIGAQRALPAAGIVRGFTLLNKATLKKTSGIQGHARTRRLSFNLSSLPVEEQVTAAELRIHLAGGRERKGRGRRVPDRQVRLCVLLPTAQNPGGTPGAAKGHSTGEDIGYHALGCHTLGAGRLGWETYKVTEAVALWRNSAARHLRHELEVRIETLVDDQNGIQLPVSSLHGEVEKSFNTAQSVRRPTRLDIEISRSALQPLLVVYSEEPEVDAQEAGIEDDAYDDDDEDGQALPTSAVTVKVERKNGTKLRARHKRPRRSSNMGTQEADVWLSRDSGVNTIGSHPGSTPKNTNQTFSRPLLRNEVSSHRQSIDLNIGSSTHDGRNNGSSNFVNRNSDQISRNGDRVVTHSMTSSTMILTGKVRLQRTVLQGEHIQELRQSGLDAAPLTSRRKRMSSGNSKSTRGRGRRRRLKRGKSSKRRARRQCRKLPMFVNFVDINWHKWVIAPKGYQAFQCSGRCDFPLSDHLTPTKHAIVQSLVHINTPDKATRSCCVPTRLDPISILYVDERNVVTYKYRYQGMMVGECGCR